MSFLENLTIKRRLQLNALVVGLAMVILLCVTIFEGKENLKLNQTIQLAKELNIQQLELRKYEKNFLFYKTESSLESFEKEYAVLDTKLAELQALMSSLNIDTQKAAQLKSLVAKYNSDFNNVVSLYSKVNLSIWDDLQIRLT